MVFKKCIDQKHVTFEFYYKDKFKNADTIYINKASKMLEFIEFCRKQNDEINLFGFTSHDVMCIVDGEYTNDELFMTFSASPLGEEYNLRFLLPYTILQWENSWADVNVSKVEDLYLKILYCLKLRETF